MSSVQVGNAGEHYVMSCPLARGTFRDDWRDFQDDWDLLL